MNKKFLSRYLFKKAIFLTRVTRMFLFPLTWYSFLSPSGLTSVWLKPEATPPGKYLTPEMKMIKFKLKFNKKDKNISEHEARCRFAFSRVITMHSHCFTGSNSILRLKVFDLFTFWSLTHVHVYETYINLCSLKKMPNILNLGARALDIEKKSKILPPLK